MQTELTKQLNIKYPIFQGGMANIAEHSLVSAVSNAGGLGILAAGGMNAEQVREEIVKTKALTDKPFGVNLMLLNPEAAKIAKVLVEEKVAVVTTGAGTPEPYMKEWLEAGIKVIPVVASVALAKRMQRCGAFAVIAEGTESGGHIGESTTMALVPQVVDAVEIPVIAAGGIGDGRGYAAARMLGAQAVQIGTRFLVAKECIIHENYKNLVLKAKDIDSVVTSRSTGHPVRVLRNAMTREYLKLEKEGKGFEELEKLTLGSLRKAVFEGDIAGGSFMAGQIAGLISKEQTAAEIMEEIVTEAKNVIQKQWELEQ
ncbi:MAG: enoyl-[Lachnospiraceae bacterium]|nr:enoyl-[acyl-carrier-protein] reductase FabK [Lachnospiraceae bacterium]